MSKHGARGPVRSWLQRKIEAPQSPPATTAPIRVNGRLVGRSDADQKKVREAAARGRGRQRAIKTHGLTTDAPVQIANLVHQGMDNMQIARRLGISLFAVQEIRAYEPKRPNRAHIHHESEAHRIQSIFTRTDGDDSGYIEVPIVSKGAICTRPDGQWIPNKPLIGDYPALRGLAGTKEQVLDTVARVVETVRLTVSAAGITNSHVAALESRAAAMRDAVARFKTKDRSAEVLTGTEIIACGGRLCDAAEKASSAARHTPTSRSTTPAATQTTPSERTPE